jgi:hypothetical protein
MEGLLTIFGILAVIVQLIVLYLFVRTANDLHFLRKEFEKLKCIHRLGEYSLAKGERIYQPGEKLYCEELETSVTIVGVSNKGNYICEYYTAEDTYYAKKAFISGDQLSELPKKES